MTSSMILMHSVLISLLALADEEASYTSFKMLPEVIIEERVNKVEFSNEFLPLNSFSPRDSEQLIPPKTGVGAKYIDSIYNELGVPFFNMNNETDLAMEREIESQTSFRFNPPYNSQLDSLNLNDSKWRLKNSITKGFDGNKSTKSSLFRIESSKDKPAFKALIYRPNSKPIIKPIYNQAGDASESKSDPHSVSKSDSNSNSNSNSSSDSHSNSENKTEFVEDIIIEGGVSRDQRWFTYKKPFANPFQPSDSQDEKFRNFHDKAYFKFLRRSLKRTWLLDADWDHKNVQLGSKVTGISKSEQLSVNSLSGISSDFRVLSFLKANNGSYDSFTNQIEGNKSNSYQAGVILKKNFKLNYIEAGVSAESSKRDYIDLSRVQFHRYKLDLLGIQNQNWNEFLAKYHIKLQGTHDDSTKKLSFWDPLSSEKSFINFTQELYEPVTMDVGMEFKTRSKTDRIWNLGFIFKARQYNLLPTPIQKFGDGMNLVGNDELPLERGTRFSSGVWFEQTGLLLEVLPFYESTLNEPVVLAISPQNAKTIGVGSIYARGLDFHLKTERMIWNFDLLYSFQEALNNSSITWQRGQSVPGRPKHSLIATIFYGTQYGWSMGSQYGFKSEEALDLSGLWKKTPHHDLKTFVGYGTKSWTLELVGSQLLSSLNDSPLQLEQGMAGYDLLNPKMESKEIHLICEFLL